MPLTPLPSLDSLRCFVEVAQRLNFRAAARAVALTPAAVSTRIKQLEDLVGAALFERTTRKVALTAAGGAFLPAAREALAAAERAVLAGRCELGPPAQHVTIGTRHELGMSWVLPALPALRAALPHVTFHLYFGAGTDLLVRVASGVLPCAIGSMKTADRRLASEPLHEETYVLVAEREYARQHPLKTERDAAQHVLVDVDDSLVAASLSAVITGTLLTGIALAPSTAESFGQLLRQERAPAPPRLGLTLVPGGAALALTGLF